MKTYTLDDLEADLRTAVDAGDEPAIDALGAVLDTRTHHPAAAPSVLASALWYAEVLGLRVFPIQAGLKLPHKGTRGFKDATTDPDTIRAWWERWPDSNLAIATGHLIDVVDIDGAAGQHSRCRNWGMFEDLHVLATVTTPRAGGMHLYVPARGVGNKAGLLPCIDYRGDGGYVLAPPSSTVDGTYRFLQPLLPEALAAAA